MTHQRKLAYVALIVNAVIWGAALPIVKPALQFVSPYQFLFYRYLLAVPFSLPFLVILFHKYRPSLKQIMTIGFMELVGVTGALSFLYEGLARTSSIEAQLISNASPVFVILGGIFFLREKEEKNEIIGLLLAIAGMLLLTLEPLITGRNHTAGFSFLGNVLVLGHNVCFAVYILLAKKLYKGVSKALIGFMSLWVGLISFYFLMGTQVPLSPEVVFANLSIPSVLLASLYMGTLGSIVAVPTLMYGNDNIEASEASLFAYLQPAVTIPLAVLWLKESISPTIILALICTVTGVIIASRRPKIFPRLAKSPKS